MRRWPTIAGSVLAIGVTVGAIAFAVAGTSRGAPMVGVLTAPGSASIEATGQLGALDTLRVDRVVAPDRSWVAVYLIGTDAMTGEGGSGVATGRPVGYVQVPAGTSVDVRVRLDTSVRLTEKVLVVLQADRGVPGRFEFDPARFDASPDKPYYVGGAAVSVAVIVRFDEMSGSARLSPAPPSASAPA